ncbi:MAG: hypothetical protein M3328_09175 [Chloroflexota bacterium]|nr:hypothetical protein [Chloroflexota bacterium]
MTTPDVANHVQEYSSPLRISSDAVELRDLVYPMADVKSVDIVSVPLNKGLWEYGGSFYEIVGALQLGRLWEDSKVWEGRVGASELALLLAATGAYVAIDYLLRWLHKRATKTWRYVYAAQLDTEYGKTFIAVAHDKTYIEKIAMTVATAITRHQESAQSTAAPQLMESPETPVIYENYFRIDDGNISITGWSTPLSEVKYANLRRLSPGNVFSVYAPWMLVPYLVVFVLMRLTFTLPDLTIVPIGYALVIALLLFLAWRTERRMRRKRGVPTANYIYVGNVTVTGGDIPALVSMDYGFVQKFVSCVKEAVSRHKASTRRPASTNRPSQRTTT